MYDPGQSAPQDVLEKKKLKRVVAASFAGALLEWYDFFIFGTASGLIFNRLFFSNTDPTLGMIAAFATFGVGFLARPLGGIVFGHFGDRVGRKSTLIATLILTGSATFLIGLLPTYESIGIWAPILLAALRLVQGFGLGGEYGGAALMTIESAPYEQRGFWGALPQMAASAGIMLATGVFALCNLVFTEQELLAWGWRIPFLLSAVMLIVGLQIRLHVEETMDFSQAKAKQARAKAHAARGKGDRHKEALPIVELFRGHPREIVLALGARLAETVSSNIINAFGIAYVSTQLALGRELPLTGMLIASFVGIGMCPLAGWISDRIGQRAVYMAGAIATLLLIFPFFMLLNSGNATLVCLAFLVTYNLGPTLMFAVQPTMFARMFRTRVRYSGLSFAYQFSAILGGLTPLIAATLLAVGGGAPWLVAGYGAVIALLSFISVVLVDRAPAPGVDDHLAPAGEDVRSN